jgi:predicted hydrocarbon binding protein
MQKCTLASGEVLGRRVAEELSEPSSLEEFLSLLREKGRDYLRFDYEMVAENRAVLRVWWSAFWRVINNTDIDKIKRAACDSELRFIEAALGRYFSAAVVRRRCYITQEGCEFVISVRR